MFGKKLTLKIGKLHPSMESFQDIHIFGRRFSLKLSCDFMLHLVIKAYDLTNFLNQEKTKLLTEVAQG